MIPKKIHYCWISGDPYPDLIQHCMASWKMYLPDYEFILWDSKRAGSIGNTRLSDALKAKKYAAASDFIRFYALFHEGGIYLDADVEVLKNFDDLCTLKSFIGFEQSGDLEAAVIGAKPHTDWVGYALREFENTPLFDKNGGITLMPLPVALNRLMTNYFQCKKEQLLALNSEQIRIFPETYFSPKSFHTQKIKISQKTYTIHHFDTHWVKKNDLFKIKLFIHKLLILIFGTSFHRRFLSLVRKIAGLKNGLHFKSPVL